MNKSKVVICLNNAWQAYNFRLNLARQLKDVGFDVVFVLPYDGQYSTLIQKEFSCYDLDIDAKGINPINDFKTSLKIYKIYKMIQPSIVLNFTIKPNIYSSIVCGLLKIPAISNITGLGTIFIKQSLVTSIAKMLYKVALSFNQKVFFQNSDDKNLFLQLNLLNESKVDILPGSGVDLNKFIPQTKTQDSEKFRFLMISRLLKDKGVYELIDAIKLLKKEYTNFEVAILGAVGVQNKTAISEDELNSWVDGDLVTYLGVTDKVESMIINYDCVLLPSYREGTPRSLLEAAAMEKPIITTNTVGCKEVVDHNVNGYLCEVKSSTDLASKMEQMICLNEEDRIEMGKAGRQKIVNKYDEKIVINKYLSAIRDVLEKEV